MFNLQLKFFCNSNVHNSNNVSDMYEYLGNILVLICISRMDSFESFSFTSTYMFAIGYVYICVLLVRAITYI